MTLNEADAIIDELQTLEFPTAFDKARAYALLKTGGIPSMTKLFMATGQNNPKNAAKRAVDTNILLMETQTNPVTSNRHFQAIARINYLHARYRAAGKILDDDMLHTLGDGLAEIVRWVNDYEWRRLSEVELCALGVWHKALGEAMEIPYTRLPSHEKEWENGAHFARELIAWTLNYENKVAVNTPNNSAFVNNYFETKAGKLHPALKPVIRQMLAADIDETMRKSMGLAASFPLFRFDANESSLPTPNIFIVSSMRAMSTLRRLYLRYLSLPRAPAQARKHLAETPNPGTKLYNFRHRYLEPWYLKASHPRQTDPGKFRAAGYDIGCVGPTPQEGKGLEEMEITIDLLQKSDRGSCPFSSGVRGS
ncbi:hypothetical protein LTS13_008083 [Exophiala xenobiotica]|nr:hypothetical protein LTR40_001632 [Exophiala xenobiotica]KAK5367230.1 hypothetical protein LTS13_008083 [Exophiala xenobiotica]